MKPVFVALFLAADFVAACATETTSERPPVDVDRNESVTPSPQVDPSSASAVAQEDSGAPTKVPDYYVGVGARGLKGDPLALVVDAKIKLFDLDGLTISTRPAVLFGAYDDEWSLPLTVDARLNSYGFAWFGGAGVRHGMDDLGHTDPMVTAGIDWPLTDRLIMTLTINYMWQVAIEDLDGELMATLNYGF